MKTKLNILLCFLLVIVVSGCNNNKNSKEELENINNHGGAVASFRLNDRVYTVDDDYAVAALNYQHTKYVLVINPDQELIEVPQNYTLNGKIKNSVFNAKKEPLFFYLLNMPKKLPCKMILYVNIYIFHNFLFPGNKFHYWRNF